MPNNNIRKKNSLLPIVVKKILYKDGTRLYKYSQAVFPKGTIEQRSIGQKKNRTKK